MHWRKKYLPAVNLFKPWAPAHLQCKFYTYLTSQAIFCYLLSCKMETKLLPPSWFSPPRLDLTKRIRFMHCKFDRAMHVKQYIPPIRLALYVVIYCIDLHYIGLVCQHPLMQCPPTPPACSFIPIWSWSLEGRWRSYTAGVELQPALTADFLRYEPLDVS